MENEKEIATVEDDEEADADAEEQEEKQPSEKAESEKAPSEKQEQESENDEEAEATVATNIVTIQQAAADAGMAMGRPAEETGSSDSDHSDEDQVLQIRPKNKFFNSGK